MAGVRSRSGEMWPEYCHAEQCLAQCLCQGPRLIERQPITTQHLWHENQSEQRSRADKSFIVFCLEDAASCYAPPSFNTSRNCILLLFIFRFIRTKSFDICNAILVFPSSVHWRAGLVIVVSLGGWVSVSRWGPPLSSSHSCLGLSSHPPLLCPGPQTENNKTFSFYWTSHEMEFCSPVPCFGQPDPDAGEVTVNICGVSPTPAPAPSRRCGVF